MSVARFPVVRYPRLPVRRVLLVMTLGAAVIGILLGSPPALAAPADAALTDSAVTVTGKPDGPFANVRVTVSHTKDLINQTGRPTGPAFTGVNRFFDRQVTNEIPLACWWQQALCDEEENNALYSYTQISDDVARDLVLDGWSPGLALITNLIPIVRAPPHRPPSYAPMVLSGLVITFNVEHWPD